MSRYQNIFFQEAFGNYRTLLQKVTLNPAMGNYLDMVNNDRASGTRVPNENYAREIMQLFSVGLEELLTTTARRPVDAAAAVPTYDQNDHQGIRARCSPAIPTPIRPIRRRRPPTKKNGVYYAAQHDPVSRRRPMAGHETSREDAAGLPTSVPASTGAVPPNQTPQQDLDAAVDNVFNHPNTPAVCRQAADPAAGDRQSVAGLRRTHRRGVQEQRRRAYAGDLKAVVKAILLDPEARGSADPTTFGSLREPVLALTSAGPRVERHHRRQPARGRGQRPGPEPVLLADGVQLLPAGRDGSGHERSRPRVRHPHDEHGDRRA